MSNVSVNGVPASDIVREAYNLIQQAKWDGVTLATAQQALVVAQMVAELINKLDADGATEVIEEDDDSDSTV